METREVRERKRTFAFCFVRDFVFAMMRETSR